MGACFSVKSNAEGQITAEQEKMLQFKPLFTLKQQLLERFNMTDDHHFSVFCTIRFRNSVRSNKTFLENIENIRRI